MGISAVGSISVDAPSGPLGNAELSRQAIVSAINKVNDSEIWPGRFLRIHTDTATRQITIQVLNSATDEVVDQIPSEEALKLADAAESAKY